MSWSRDHDTDRLQMESPRRKPGGVQGSLAEHYHRHPGQHGRRAGQRPSRKLRRSGGVPDHRPLGPPGSVAGVHRRGADVPDEKDARAGRAGLGPGVPADRRPDGLESTSRTGRLAARRYCDGDFRNSMIALRSSASRTRMLFVEPGANLPASARNWSRSSSVHTPPFVISERE